MLHQNEIVLDKFLTMIFMRGPREFCQRGSSFDNVFLVCERRELGSRFRNTTTIIGPILNAGW